VRRSRFVPAPYYADDRWTVRALAERWLVGKRNEMSRYNMVFVNVNVIARCRSELAARLTDGSFYTVPMLQVQRMSVTARSL
jgi:hypothetical protein